MSVCSSDKKSSNFLKKNLFLICILASILVGFLIGIGLKSTPWAGTDKVLWFTLPGELFIRALSMLILPVIFVGVVSATSSLSPKVNMRLTLVSFGIIILTHVIAAFCAMGGVLIIKQIGVVPAMKASNQTVAANTKENSKTTYDIVADLLRNLFPKNIFKAMTHQELTRYASNKLNSSLFERNVIYIEGTNLLGLLVFAILLGIASSLLEQKAQLFRDLFKSANEIVTLVLKWLITLAPIGVASLIIDAVLGVDDLLSSLTKIGIFAGICTLTLVFYSIVGLGKCCNKITGDA